MNTFRKINSRSITLRSSTKTKQNRHELRSRFHRLNRKGLIPPSLRHETKMADSIEDIDVIEQDENNSLDDEVSNFDDGDSNQY